MTKFHLYSAPLLQYLKIKSNIHYRQIGHKYTDENQKLLNKVKTELETQKDQLVQKLQDVETKRKKNKEEVQMVVEKITERKNSDDKDLLLREKENLLKSQWKLDEEKKLYERQILNIDKSQHDAEDSALETTDRLKAPHHLKGTRPVYPQFRVSWFDRCPALCPNDPNPAATDLVNGQRSLHKEKMFPMNLLSIIAGTGFLLLIFTCKGEAQQTDLPQSVTVMVGEDVVLPCFLKPPKDATKMTVEWGRPDLKPRFVFVNLDGKEYSADQNEAFRGRSSMIPENLKNGDVSLKLSDVRISDSGRYRCYLPREKKEYFTELVVGSASSPGISLSGLDVSSSGVMLDCSAAGWYPEPEMFWLDGDGNIMSPGAAEKSTDPDGVYTVSSRVTVEKRNNNNFTCRVQQRDINQSRETHIHVPDGFFVPQPDCSVSIGSIVILVFTLIIGAATFTWKWRQTEISKKKLKEEVNEEKKQLMTKEKENLSEKKSELEEEIKHRNEDQRIIDQLIEALMEMSEELKDQRKQLSDEREKTERMIEEDEEKLNSVIDEERNQTGSVMEKRATGYLKLKAIMTESLEKLDKRKKDHQHVELMTVKLIEKTCKEVKMLKERKQEIEKNVEEINKQLEEMKT
ncbi:selection and upkeep of intraepithelial T-cells protein 5-like [Poecilia formosa]|uniref:selection and upkeep of intraepithelial T-cells protein 5-like n=1 Tax=Poecilia formosa TaxID=48698 RepID=UPI0007B932C5|nr:PREDICTED: selection and upkeep of intraepithelial T-cells protein 5-like [Poecilia formosa]